MKPPRATNSSNKGMMNGGIDDDRDDASSSKAFGCLSFNTVHILLAFVGGLFNFLPMAILSFSSFEEGSTVYDTLQYGTKYYDTSIAILALAPPLLIDSIVDAIQAKPKLHHQAQQDGSKSKSLNLKEMITLLLGIVLAPSFSFMPRHTPMIGLINFCAQQAQVVLLLGALGATFSRYNPQFWKPTLTAVMIAIFGATNMWIIFSLNAKLAHPDDAAINASYVLGTTVFFVCVLIFFVQGFLWAYFTFRNPVFQWLRRSKVVVSETFTTNRLDPKISHKRAGDSAMEKNLEFYPRSFVSGTLLFAFIAVIIRAFVPQYDNLSDDSFFSLHLIFIVAEMMLLIFFLRRIKAEAVQRLYALVDAKKSYVRYISHELRTPLNAAYLGLELVMGDLKDSADPEDIDRYETLSDVSHSCHSAVEILNDLLCFDKIESGILELFKQEVPLIPFLKDGVSLFSAPARSRNIHLILDVTDPILDINEIARNVTAKFKAGVGASPVRSRMSVTAPSPPPTSVSVDNKTNRHKTLGARVVGAVSQSMWSFFVAPSPAELHADGGGGYGGSDSAKGGQGDEGLPVGLIDGDEIAMDRFKMDQVLRNLISNALKFTPAGGTVTVQAIFIPDAPVDLAPKMRRHYGYVARGVAHLSSHVEAAFGGSVKKRTSGTGGRGSRESLEAPKSPASTSAGGGNPDRYKSLPGAGYGDEEGHDRRTSLEASQQPQQEQQQQQPRNVSTQQSASSTQDGSAVGGPGLGRSSIIGGSVGVGAGSTKSRKMSPASILSSDKNGLSAKGSRKVSLAGVVNIASAIEIFRERRRSSSVVSEALVRGKLRFSVTDTGAGISPENQKRLFKEVVQFNPEILQAGGGSGFGLFITQNIVALHGGRISVFSEGEGKGSTFTVEIPMTRPRDCVGKRGSYTSQFVYAAPSAGASPRLVGSGSASAEERRASPLFLQQPQQAAMPGRSPRAVLAGRGGGGGSWKTASRSGFESGSAGSGLEDGSDSGERASGRLESAAGGNATGDGAGGGGSWGGGGEIDGDGVRGTSVKTSAKNTRVQAKDKDKLRLKLLIVDDSLMNRKMLSKVLQSKGHECEQAEDGEIAVQMVKDRLDAVNAEAVSPKALYDAILMDFVMPNMDGPTATRHIRDLGYSNPIYGVTGNALETDIDHFITSGATKVIPKPFNVAAFEEMMAERRKPSAAAMLQMSSSKAILDLTDSVVELP